MKLEITPYVSERPLEIKPDHKAEVKVSPKYDQFINAMVTRTRAITRVATDGDERSVSNAIGELKRVIDEIDAEKAVRKGPLLAILNSIEDAAKRLKEGPSSELERLEQLVLTRANDKQQEREAAVSAAYTEKENLIEARQQKLVRLENERQALDLKRREAVGLEDYAALDARVRELSEEVDLAKLYLDSGKNSPVSAPIFTQPLFNGVSLRDSIHVELESAQKLVELSGDKGWDLFRTLVKCEIKQLMAQQVVKDMIEAGDPNPVIPGCQVSLGKKAVKRRSVPVRLR